MALLTMELQLVVRPVVRGDLSVVEALDAEVYGAGAYGPWVLRQLFDLQASSFFVAEVEGRIVGYVVGGLGDDGVAWMLSLATAVCARGQGVAAALVAHWVARWADGAVPCARLTVAPDNVVALRLYEKHGFSVIADEADYFGPGERRLILQRNFPN